MEIIITHNSQGWFVHYQDKKALSLTWDEMLGLITALTLPESRPCLNWLRTEEQNKSMREYLDSLSDKNISQKGEQC